ncbi:MAG: phosphoribosylaminoimidazolesuccinocarboxamide synthase [Cuniculiplasma sp.]
MELIRKGKVKDVYDNGNSLIFRFSDRISVFDKIIPVMIPNKGESVCRTSAYWFQIVEKELGIKTHFLKLINGSEMEVKKFRVNELGGSKFWVNYLIPLEFVMRHYAAGTLIDRIKGGKIDKSDLGMNRIPQPGERLDEPFFEMTTKFEKTDRPLNFQEASEIGGITMEEIYKIKETILKIDRKIEKEVAKRNLIHADGKREFAMGEGRDIVIVDTFGTADEDRFWELDQYKKGRIVELSKESVRKYYRDNGYHDRLYKARESGTVEPEIDPLPENLISSTSDLYKTMFERITGEKWRGY